jgi:hypothetical protein
MASVKYGHVQQCGGVCGRIASYENLGSGKDQARPICQGSSEARHNVAAVVPMASHSISHSPLSWSGWPDLNRRPLRPEANARCGLPPHLLRLTCLAPSADVLWRPLVSVAVVTQLVTHPPRGMVMAASGLRHQPRTGLAMTDVVRRLVERRAAQFVTVASAGDQGDDPCSGR